MANTALTRSQVTSYASGAGFTGTALTTAVDIAYAESGWNPDAHNSTPPDDSYGLWQINMLGSLGPARRSQFGISSNSALYNPATNAKAAYSVYVAAGRSFTPWSTYTSGAYRNAPDASISSGDSGLSTSGGSSSSDGSDGSDNPPPDPNSGIEASIDHAVETLRRIAIIVLVMIIAIICIILGVVLINRQKVGTVAKAGIGIASKGLV